MNYRLKQLIKANTVKAVYKLTDKSVYEVGKYYWCGYWQKYYKVLAVGYKDYGYPKSVTIRWEDGRVTTHCTSLDSKKDYELIVNE